MKKSELKQLIREVKQEVLNESKDIISLPKEEQAKIIAQYEAIRQAGQYNMFDFYGVQRAAFENGYYEFVNFTNNDKKAYSSILKNYGKLIKKVERLPVYRKLRIKRELD